MAIKIQDGEVDVDELVGTRCRRLIAVPGAAIDLVLFLYILADDTWYRFFLDSQLLFLDECKGPDRADDLTPGDEYFDLGEVLGCVDALIEEFTMQDGTLTIRFSGGESLVLSEGKSSVGPASGRTMKVLN
jgi:hypothetical protein